MNFKKVSILFAANEGLLDDVANSDISRFKKEWFAHLAQNLKSLSDNLNDGSALSDDDKSELKNEIEKFKKTF